MRTDIPARLDRLPWASWHWRVLLGLAIEVGTVNAVASGYYLGASLMILAGLVELLLGVEAARKPLEQVAPPLSVVE